VYNKKGDVTFPLYATASIAIIILTIFTYSIVFFFLGLAETNNNIIKMGELGDSSLLLNILTTQQEDNRTLSDLIILIPEDENYKQVVKDELMKIIPNLEKPDKRGEWNFFILSTELNEDENYDLFRLNPQDPTKNVYFRQDVYLPTKDKQVLDVGMVFVCDCILGEENE